ncbi:MAG: type II toxin-antitoxin system RelE/ParE family toxin [Bryobacteraceae bacterium]
MKRIIFSEQAIADIRAIPRQTAMQILIAIHRLAETGAGRVKTLQGQGGEKRLRVGDFRVRFTEESGTGPQSANILQIHTVRNRKEAYR